MTTPKKDHDIEIKVIGGTPVLPLVTIALLISAALRRFGFKRIDIRQSGEEYKNDSVLRDEQSPVINTAIDDVSVVIDVDENK